MISVYTTEQYKLKFDQCNLYDRIGFKGCTPCAIVLFSLPESHVTEHATTVHVLLFFFFYIRHDITKTALRMLLRINYGYSTRTQCTWCNLKSTYLALKVCLRLRFKMTLLWFHSKWEV